MQPKELNKILLFSVIIVFQISIFGQDWPTYQNNNQRSGVSSTDLNSPLFLRWKYQAAIAPRPAWPDPAKTDFWHREANLKPRVVYDRAYHIISVGNKVYFGSSANDKIYCIDANTGEEKWSYFTGGPVRFAPSYYGGFLYVGADDGVVYCLNAQNGDLKWKINTAKGERYLPGNERVISIYPVRTGVLVDDSIAYFASGLFPNEGVNLFAVNTQTGGVLWQRFIDISPQGYMLASKSSLYIPTGRTMPKVFSRKDGSKVGDFNDGSGGTYALLVDDEIIYGPGDEGKLSSYPVCKADDEIATFLGLQLIVKGDISYLRSDNELSAIRRQKYISDYKNWEAVEDKKSVLADKLWDLREDRKTASLSEVKIIDRKISSLIERISQFDEKREKIEAGGLIWKTKINGSYSMILAGNSLVVGGNNKVEIYNVDTGEKIWEQKVDGIVYSLAAANGSLLASTDKGNIYSFSAKRVSNPNYYKPEITENPYKDDSNIKLYEDAANKILHSTGVTRGYCLVVGSGTGQLAYELAKHSDLNIIGIEEDAEKVKKSRRLLDQAGIYGKRVSIIHGDIKKLPFNKYFADLIVSDKLLMSGEFPVSADEIYRVVKPYGGIAYLGVEMENKSFMQHWVETSGENWDINENWAYIKRSEISGAGEWTHLYAEPGNTACSNDSVQGPFQIQWFGQPGPREMINRHSRPMSPLFKDGRLFIPGDNRIICVDAYNGTPLWNRYVPDSRVLGALRDCGTMAVATDYIYIAAGQTALGFNVENGKQDIILEAPQLIPGQESKWGYLAIVNDQIFGSGKKSTASVTIVGRDNCDTFEGDYRDMITSDYLFSLDRNTGEKFWTYRGLVFNNTITIGGDYIYFIESRNPKAVSDFDGRLRVDRFCVGPTYIVKMNKRTGIKEWEKEFKFPYSQIMFLAFSDNILLVTGSFNVGAHVHYKLFAFNGDNGKEIWNTEYQGGKKGGSHGEQWQHPVVIGDKIFLLPYIFNLYTGDKGDLYLTRGGCGTFSGSAYNLFARNSNPSFYDLYGEQNGEKITRVNRPGCWINIIPAGDLISIPEASSGCTCNYPIQTSFVFISKD
jgi:outer membrane protein assembly factor BamB